MHAPVLLNEVLEYLDPRPGGKFVDATINGGGHARAILDKIAPDGKLLGLDWDESVLNKLKVTLQSNAVVLINTSYVNLEEVARGHGFEDVNGVLFDLGLSSWQLELSGKGFSFMRNEPLDMRYDINDGTRLTAAEIVNQYSAENLKKIFTEYGEEQFAENIAVEIIRARSKKQISTTGQLVEIIKSAVPFWYRYRRKHFATQTFQALRITVNEEFTNIETGIDQAIRIVKPGGRVAVITFHSLEDKLVKNIFREKIRHGSVSLINKKAIKPKWAEVSVNRRARSAKLRIIAKK